MNAEVSISGLKELQVQKAQMFFRGMKGSHHLIVVFYHLDGTSKPYAFTELDTVQPLSDHPDSVWVKGVDVLSGAINQAINNVVSISSELVEIKKTRQQNF